MAERPDLRQISSNIAEALADCDADTLRDILTFVFKEYIVEGPPPFLVHQSERIEDLEGLSFAEVITALQTRLDLPELALFQVDRAQVSVRIGGQSHPLVARGGPQQPLSAPAAAPAPPQPGVRVEEVELPRRPQPQSQPQPQPQQPAGVPRAAAGLSISGRPAGGDMMGHESRPTAAPEQPTAPTGSEEGGQAAPATEAPDKEPPEEDDASTRFSLLELD